MDYEKLHKDTINRLQQMVGCGKITVETACGICADFVPESEDERIRKELIEQVVYIVPNDDEVDSEGNVLPTYQKRIDKYRAWLEKQGKQKPVPDWMPKFLDELRLKKNYFDWDEHKDIEGGILAIIEWMKPNYFNGKCGEQKSDKVEPKFKVGDWCIDNEDGTIFQIVKVLDNTYTYKTNEGKEYSCTHYSLENDARLWTIQDAKDGDVLVCGDFGYTSLMLFESFSNGRISLHCWYNSQTNNFHINTDGALRKDANIYPSTKEQRDLLFQKMKEAGYEWDAEKKELKKIEQKPTDKVEPKFKVGDTVTVKPMSCHGKVFKGEPFKIVDIIEDNYVSDDGKAYSISLQDGWELVEQKPTWSEEDRKIIIELIGIFESAVDGGHVTFPYRLLKDYIRILKSCLPQNT